MALTMPPAVFAREFCTVHLDVGRQVGKTTYIKERAVEGDVIISASMERKLNAYRGARADVFAPYHLDNPHFLMSRRGRHRPSFIYVDEPDQVQRLCQGQSLRIVYDAFASGQLDQTFVLLGH